MRQSGVQHSRLRLGLILAAKKAVVTIIVVVVMMVVVLQEEVLLAEGRATKRTPSSQQPRRKQKVRAGVGRDFSEFLIIMGAIMTCAIAPIFLVFLHSIYKDPDTPDLARKAWKAFKKKFVSYLGHETPRSPQGNPSSETLPGSDRSPILSPPLRRDDRRRERWIVHDGDEDEDEDDAYLESNEDAIKSTARSIESRPTTSTRRRKETPDITKYQPLLLHEYAPYLRRRCWDSVEEGADNDDDNKNREKKEPSTTTATTTTTTPAAARGETTAPFTTTPITTAIGGRTKSLMFLQQREREDHDSNYYCPDDDLGFIRDDYDDLLSSSSWSPSGLSAMMSRAIGHAAQQSGDGITNNNINDNKDDFDDGDEIRAYGAGRKTSVDTPGVMGRWDNEEIGDGEEKKYAPGDGHEGENTMFTDENDHDGGSSGDGGVYKSTQSRRKLTRSRRLRG